MAEDNDEVSTLSARLHPWDDGYIHTDDGFPPNTPDRLLLDAARNDNVDQLDEVFAKHGKFDINFQDG
jgi:hypothetical protein